MDYVVCVDAVEHVVDLDRVIGEASRVLRPRGKVPCDTINRTLLAALMVVFFGERIFGVLPNGDLDIRFGSFASILACPHEVWSLGNSRRSGCS